MKLTFKQILSFDGFLVGLTEDGSLYQLWGSLASPLSHWKRIDYPVAHPSMGQTGIWVCAHCEHHSSQEALYCGNCGESRQSRPEEGCPPLEEEIEPCEVPGCARASVNDKEEPFARCEEHSP